MERLRAKIGRSRSLVALERTPAARSVALEVQKELGKGPLRPEALAAFCAARERRQEAKASDFVRRNCQLVRSAGSLQLANLR